MAILTWILQNFWATLFFTLIALVGIRIAYRFTKYGFNRKEATYILRRSPFYIVVLVFCFFAAAPFLIMFLHSFKGDSDLYRRPQPFIYRDEPTNEHIETLFYDTSYVTFIRNSVVVGIAVVIVTLILSLPAAYALARLTGRWGERAGILMFLVYLVPPTLLFIPMFRIVVWMGLKDNPAALILIYPTFTVPFSMWLLQGFFKAIPPELEEAALVDGYNRIEAFFWVVMPLSIPGIIATVVFTFTLTLHEFIYALVFITDTQQRTLSVGVPTELILGDVYFWQPLLAAAFLIAIPVGLAYNLFLDSLVQGFTMGAVKG